MGAGSAPLASAEDAKSLVRSPEPTAGAVSAPHNWRASSEEGARQIKYRRVAQCAWCRLGDRFPEALEEAHRAHLVDGVGARVIVRVLGERAAAIGEKLPSHRALTRHFRNHLCAVEAQQEAPPRPPVVVIAEESAANGRELGELWTVYRSLDRQIRQLEGAISFSSDAGQTDLHRVAQLTGLCNAARGVLDAIVRARKSEGTIVEAARHSVRAALMSFGHAVHEELRAIAVSPDVAERINGWVRESFTKELGRAQRAGM